MKSDKSIRARWRSLFGDCPPLGFLLRESFPDRWLRIHSLRSGKRYPETAVEVATMLSRHNTVATELLGDGAPCVVIANPAPNPLHARGQRSRRQLDALGFRPVMIVEEPDTPVGADGWHIPLSAASIRWREGALNDVLEDVAHDLVSPLLIVAIESGRVYAPYDGGADLFLCSPAERDAHRERWSEWLPTHSSGL
ncbi:MAG TPA: hypothetical protein VMM18_08710 [Gemmatimonadaceae bacterium]|nr:hypothetical protein [Gemmatimonadaceae bacterium]